MCTTRRRVFPFSARLFSSPIKSRYAWLPKSVVCLTYYDRFRFRSDLIAALILASQIFPAGIAIATASGLRPLYGISCAAIAGVLASGLGDSKIRISAPSIVFVAVASSIVGREGTLGLSLSTFLAGVLLILLGAIGLGAAVPLIPRPVVVGFSTGIAVLVGSELLSNLLGLGPPIPIHGVWAGVIAVTEHVKAISPHAIAMATATLIVITACRRVSGYVPGSLIAMTMGALLVKFQHSPVQTIGACCGTDLLLIPRFPTGSLRLDLLGGVLAQAFAIAILVAIESVQAMGLATSLTGERHNPNVELLVHGGVNLASAIVGGLPTSGVCDHTATNARVGAQTPVAGMLQVIFLPVFLLLTAPLLRYVPLPVISAILLSSVCSMPHWREIPRLMRLTRTEAGAWLATSFMTIAIDLPMAVAVGMVIGMFLYIRKQRRPGAPHD